MTIASFVCIATGLFDVPLDARFKIPEKFLPVAGTEYSRNRNFDRNFDFVPVISGVF
jgi:hypothetical protein